MKSSIEADTEAEYSEWKLCMDAGAVSLAFTENADRLNVASKRIKGLLNKIWAPFLRMAA